MQISFDLPHVFFPGSSREENASALRILLDSLIALNRAFLRNHSVPDLYRSGVVYDRTTVWDTIPALYARGYGDCKSLTAAYVAQHRHNGIDCDPVFRWKYRGGPDRLDTATDFHILVLMSDGTFHDPSKVLGMGKNENGPARRRR